MSEHVILIEHPGDWKPHYPVLRVITARQYLEDPPDTAKGPLRVINLCRDFSYLSVGYYCSLLAEARRHKIVPTVRTVQDLSRRSIYSLDTEDLDRLVHKVLGRRGAGLQPTAFELLIFFGQTSVKEMQEIARQVFEAFRAPLLKVEFKLQGNWRIAGIKTVPLNILSEAQAEAFFEALQTYLQRPWRSARRSQGSAKYDLAILYNPDELLPPSNAKALRRFVQAAKSQGLRAELIQRKDYARLAEYDALFIRETTRLDDYTYQFARRADSEGMVVMDDPDSILKCTNKVYLAELLRNNRVPTPETVIVSKETLGEVEKRIAYPIVLKIPDGSFSRGVFKVGDHAELLTTSRRLFKESDLILAQEFMPTDFDWRIGILDKQPIFACKYFMSKRHWQIVNHTGSGRPKEGGFETYAVEDAPAAVVKTALRAANLIGDGFYGVDLKETQRGVVVIEVNDNPSVDSGVEDAVLGDDLYRIVLEDFLRRLDNRRGR